MAYNSSVMSHVMTLKIRRKFNKASLVNGVFSVFGRESARYRKRERDREGARKRKRRELFGKCTNFVRFSPFSSQWLAFFSLAFNKNGLTCFSFEIRCILWFLRISISCITSTASPYFSSFFVRQEFEWGWNSSKSCCAQKKLKKKKQPS